MVEVNVDSLIAEIENEAARVRDDAALLVLEACREACPVSPDSPTASHAPGQLRDSLDIDGVFDESPHFVFEIASPLDYAQFTDEVDTEPHRIFAVYSRSLRFWWENGPHGADIYNYFSVNHPGTTGQKWFASQNEQRFDDALNAAVN